MHGMGIDRCRVTSMHDFDAAAPLRKGSLFCACHGGAKRTHQWDDKQRKSRACSYVDPDDVDTFAQGPIIHNTY